MALVETFEFVLSVLESGILEDVIIEAQASPEIFMAVESSESIKMLSPNKLRYGNPRCDSKYYTSRLITSLKMKLLFIKPSINTQAISF